MLRPLLCLVLLWLVSGCQRNQNMDATAQQEAIETLMEIERIHADTGIRLGALSTWDMTEAFARRSRIYPHGDGIVLLLVGLHEMTPGKMVEPPARIEATATDSRGRTRPVA